MLSSFERRKKRKETVLVKECQEQSCRSSSRSFDASSTSLLLQFLDMKDVKHAFSSSFRQNKMRQNSFQKQVDICQEEASHPTFTRRSISSNFYKKKHLTQLLQEEASHPSCSQNFTRRQTFAILSSNKKSL